MIVIEAVGVGLEVELNVAVREVVSAAVDVDKPVIVLDADELAVSLDVRDGLAPSEIVGDDEDVILEVREESGKSLDVFVPVAETVSEPDNEAVGVTVADGVFVALSVAVALEESEILEVIEADAPFVRELVGVREIDRERL